MMSLFSSFDLKQFYLASLFMLMVLLVFFSSSFLLSKKFLLIREILNFSQMIMSNARTQVSKSLMIIFSTLFFYLILINYFSIFPFIFPLSSQMSLVLFSALTIWLGLVMFMIVKNLKGFISHCIPEGTPLPLVCFLFLIELISQLIRPLTLTVRLVANILAGHLLMILLSNLALNSFTSFLPYVLLNAVEMFVAFIQAYIMVTMVCLYYGEVS